MTIPRVQLVRQTRRSRRSPMLPVPCGSSGSAPGPRSASSPACASPSRAAVAASTTSSHFAKATVDALKELGAKPFVVAAMGSHGGATPEGQRELLASYDIDEAHLGVPVVTDMDAVNIGTNSLGQPVWWDKNALDCRRVVTVSRVKPHTDFRGKFESGILKMLVIGLGKRTGPTRFTASARGLRDMIPDAGAR